MQHVEPDSLVTTKNSPGLSKCSKTQLFSKIHLAHSIPNLKPIRTDIAGEEPRQGPRWPAPALPSRPEHPSRA